MGCIISIIASVVTLNCPTPVSTGVDAARILAPWQFVAPARVERPGPVVIERPRPVEQVVPRESEAGRAIRMGIPGGWTPLEWAILNGGR
jgi:hypothetical protein